MPFHFEVPVFPINILSRFGIHRNHRFHRVEGVCVQVAGYEVVVAHVFYWGGLGFADFADFAGAAGLDRAAGGRVDGGWEFAGQDDVFFVHRGGGDGHRREQRLGVGVVGRREHLVGVALLHDGAEIHDDDAVGQVAHHREVVADEQQRGFEAVLNVGQQAGYRGLHRYIERRDRLVGDHHRRVAGEGAGDADALLLAAGQLTRFAEGEIARQFDEV